MESNLHFLLQIFQRLVQICILFRWKLIESGGRLGLGGWDDSSGGWGGWLGQQNVGPLTVCLVSFNHDDSHSVTFLPFCTKWLFEQKPRGFLKPNPVFVLILLFSLDNLLHKGHHYCIVIAIHKKI